MTLSLTHQRSLSWSSALSRSVVVWLVLLMVLVASLDVVDDHATGDNGATKKHCACEGLSLSFDNPFVGKMVLVSLPFLFFVHLHNHNLL
eukprot:gene14595-10435_t